MSSKKSELRNFRNRLNGVTMPIIRKRSKWGRNSLCLCGSGKKYKHCCLEGIDELTSQDGNAEVMKLPEDVQNMIDQHIARQNRSI